jgi:P27 family predicted phage terminase small subunit
MPDGAKPRTLEARRAAGEQVTHLPVIVGGRPRADELERPPASLDKWGKAAWREVVPQLLEAKLIDRVDMQAVEAYCLHLGRARALREAIEWLHEEPKYNLGTGEILNPKTYGRRLRRRTLDEQFRARTARGFTSNPLLSQEREAMREARMMGELLGLNPVGRTRLTGPKKAQGGGIANLTGNLPRPALTVVPAPGEP